MKVIRIFALCAFLVAASAAEAQDQQEGGAMPPMGAPEQMKAMDFLLGDWDVELSFRMGPDTEWMKSKGSARVELELDGCVQTMHYEGEFMGTPFVGKDTMTYNRETNQFESFWIDSMSAHASPSSGNWEGAKMIMTGKDKQMGQDYWSRTTTTKVSDSEVSFLMEMSMDGEHYFENMKMVYKKKG